MTNEDKIAEVLRQLSTGTGICDDCLSAKADVSPRQTVNQICRKLRDSGAISRGPGVCSAGHHRPEKLLNSCNAGCGKSSATSSPSIGIGEQTNVLSQWLFDACKFLNQSEHLADSKEPFAARVARLKREGTISPSLSSLMQLLNTYRVQVVKGRKPLETDEWQLVVQSNARCRSER